MAAMYVAMQNTSSWPNTPCCYRPNVYYIKEVAYNTIWQTWCHGVYKLRVGLKNITWAFLLTKSTHNKMLLSMLVGLMFFDRSR